MANISFDERSIPRDTQVLGFRGSLISRCSQSIEPQSLRSSENPFPLRTRRFAGHSLFLLFIAVTLFVGWKHPYYSWDMLGYIASVLSIDDGDPVSVHKMTFAFAEENMPAKDYDDIIDAGIPYRQNMRANPEHFWEQLPFFKVKPLYIFVLYGLYKVGVDPVHGSILISCIASVLCALLVRKWLSKDLPILSASLWSILLLLTAGIFEFAGITTPDALSSCFLLFALYLSVTRSSHVLTFTMLFLAFLVRMDNILLIAGYAGYRQLVTRDHKVLRPILISLAAAILIMAGVESAIGYYGWQVHFYHTFVQTLAQPSHYSGSIGLGQYCLIFVEGLRFKPPCNLNLFFVFLVIAGSTLLLKKNLLDNRMFQAVCLTGFVSAIHYLIFPALLPRFFFGYYLIAGIFFIQALGTVKLSRREVDFVDPLF